MPADLDASRRRARPLHELLEADAAPRPSRRVRRAGCLAAGADHASPRRAPGSTIARSGDTAVGRATARPLSSTICCATLLGTHPGERARERVPSDRRRNQILVEDDGPGIAVDNRARVLLPGVREPTRPPAGTVSGCTTRRAPWLPRTARCASTGRPHGAPASSSGCPPRCVPRRPPGSPGDRPCSNVAIVEDHRLLAEVLRSALLARHRRRGGGNRAPLPLLLADPGTGREAGSRAARPRSRRARGRRTLWSRRCTSAGIRVLVVSGTDDMRRWSGRRWRSGAFGDRPKSVRLRESDR